MLEKCKITGFADEIDEKLEIQLEVLKELGQKYMELRSADG
ncbi:MAG: sugar phosphate isomerase/epimerase, partial [Lachnospiraceae bacterium]|nr:sugar phosphate isomerase/epimerase [Lachnospiraceae bacterium]